MKKLVLCSIVLMVICANSFAEMSGKMNMSDVAILLGAVNDSEVQKDFKDAMDSGKIQSITAKQSRDITKQTKTFVIDTIACLSPTHCLGGSILTIKATPVVLPGHTKYSYTSDLKLKK